MVSQSVLQAVENERIDSKEVERLRAIKPKKSQSKKSSNRFSKSSKEALAKSITRNASLNQASKSRSTTQQPVPNTKSVQTSLKFKTVLPPTPTIASTQPSKAKKTSAQEIERQKVQSKTVRSKPQTVLPPSSSAVTAKNQSNPLSINQTEKMLDPFSHNKAAKDLTN